ncbi:MAG: TldD/PmbA family protein [Clostridiales bacterium]|nr:TldD/PmbA family protein [Clostridiales bacterium]
MTELKKYAAKVLEEAKKLGADYAQVTVSESEKREFNVDGGSFSLMRTLFNRDVSLTVLKDKRKGSVSMNRFGDAEAASLAKDAIDACLSGQPDDAWEYCAEPCEEEFVYGAPQCDTNKLFIRTKELLENINERYPKIIMEQMITDHTAAKVVYLNTNGVCYKTSKGKYDFSLMYSAHDGEKGTSFFGDGVSLKNLDRPVIEEALLDKELSQIQAQLDASPMDGKFVGTAVLTPGALGEIVLGTALYNFLSDGCLIDGTSIWKDKLGEKVADDRISISFEPMNETMVTGSRYTSEGFRAEDYEVIRDGKLNSFCLSRYAANKTGNKPASNDSSCVVMKAGDRSLDEIIAGIDKGIYVMRFSGGQPAPSGEFSGVAKNSFLIEHGRITRPLTETMISGNVADMLNDLVGISSETCVDGSSVLPYAAFGGVTISGK